MALPDPGTAADKLYQTLLRHETNARQAIADITLIKSQLAGLEQVEGDYILEGDARLSDHRQPLAHTHLLSDVSDAGTSASLNVPASGDAAASEVVKGNDSRLTDNRDPNTHASDHASGGADPVDHNTLLNYDLAQHRVINDSGTSSTELWSADKISSELAAAVNNLDYKANVDTVATADITLYGEQTVNGVLTSGSRVGVVGQTDSTQNGVYVSSSGAWTRATDCDDDDEVTTGLTFFVTDGDKAGFQYILITYNPITVGSTGLVFTEVRKLVFGSTAGTATEGNDPRIPTQDEKDALTGTGVPSSGNLFVTQDTHDAVDSRVTTNESNISTNQGNISTLQSDMSTAQSDITTNQGNISTLQSDVSAIQSDPRWTDTRDPNAHASDHQHGGSDEIATATPAANAIPKANGSGVLDKAWLPAATESDQGAVQLAENLETAAKPIQSKDDRVVLACDAATTADIDIDSATPSDTYDGVTLSAFDILLVHNQATASENGVYVFTDTATQLSRVIGFNTSADWASRKKTFIVREGTTQKGVYIAEEASGFTLNTNDLEFTSIFGSAALNSSSDFLQPDLNGQIPSLLIDTLLNHPDIRGTAFPHYGGHPDTPFGVIENIDNSVFVCTKGGGMYITNSDGTFMVPAGLAVQKDTGEMDIEVVLEDGSRVSVGSLDGDNMDIDGHPYRPGYQLDTHGASAVETMIQGRGF